MTNRSKSHAPITRALVAIALLALGLGAVALNMGAPSTQAAAPAVPLDGTENLPPGASIETVLPGMTQPIAMVFDNAGRLFYTERNTGNVRLFAGGVLQTTPVINFTISSSGERGLLGITRDPDFANNRYVYVYYTSPDITNCAGFNAQNKVVRFEENNGVGSNPVTIFTSCQSAGNHVGGNLHFGQDGKLYITIGDNANQANSQNLNVTQGKIHRINSDGTIPADNPFPGAGAPSIWALGLRNSFDFTFDDLDTTAPYRIFSSENGPSCDDEMNRIERGFNYGWRSGYPCGDRDPQYNTIAPLWYLPSGQCCIAPTGIEVYTGTQIPQWTGELFMAAYNNRSFRHFYLSDDRTVLDQETNVVIGVSAGTDIETGPDGALYYIEGGGYSSGILKRIVGPGGGSSPTPVRTSTPVPPSNTPLPTNTSPPPTSTNTSVPSATNTLVVPTATTAPTNTTGPTSTGTVPTSTRTNTSVPANTATRSATSVAPSVSPGTPIPPTATHTRTATSVPPTSTPTTCALPFTDVPPSDPFYAFIRCLFCRGIVGGYPDGTFRPNNPITRGQIAKVVSESAGFDEDPGAQIYQDVPPSETFYQWINRLSRRGHMGGYPCGQRPTEPCLAGNRPYFRPNEDATRGQLSKIVANAAAYGEPVGGQFYTDVPPTNPFYTEIMRLTNRGVMSGYPCGGVGEPCDAQNRPYFRWGNNVTRGQASKIVVNTFFGSCPPPPPGTENVEIVLYQYQPQTITVRAGTAVRWYNYDQDYHTSTSGVCVENDCTPDGHFNTGNIYQYDSSAVTLTTPGTYHYYCIPHPYMQADVIVVP